MYITKYINYFKSLLDNLFYKFCCLKRRTKTINLTTHAYEMPKRENFFIAHRMDILWWFIIVILLLFAAFKPIGIDKDSQAYAQAILDTTSSHFKNIYLQRFEPSFYLIIYLSHLIFSDVVRGVFILYAVLAVFLKAYAIQKILGRSFFALFVYICLFYILHELTQIRAGVAIGIFLLSLDDIIQRKPGQYYLKTVIAILFHYSSLIMIPLYFFNERNRILYYLPLTVICIKIFLPGWLFNTMFVYIFKLFPQVIEDKLLFYFFDYGLKNLPFVDLFIKSKIFIFYTLFQYGVLLGEKKNIIQKLNQEEIVMLTCISLGISSYFLFINQRALAFRLSEFLLSVLIFFIPLIKEKFLNKKYALFYVLGMSLALLTIILVDQIIRRKLLLIEYLI